MIFKKYLSQPLHTTLHDFRIIAVVSIISAWLMLWDIWFYLKDNGSLDSSEFTLGVIGLASTMLGTIWKAINHIQESIKSDQ